MASERRTRIGCPDSSRRVSVIAQGGSRSGNAVRPHLWRGVQRGASLLRGRAYLCWSFKHTLEFGIPPVK